MFLVRFKNGRRRVLNVESMAWFLLFNHCALSMDEVCNFLSLIFDGAVLYFDGVDNFEGEFECSWMEP